MSAVTNQPVPVGQLEREKHIQMIFRAFKNRCEPSCECQTQASGAKPHRELPDWESEDQLSDLTPQRGAEDLRVQAPGALRRLELEEQKPEGAGSLDFMSVLERLSQIHITARPELQGPQCVSRRIYSITTGGRKSQLFVAVEESSCVCLQCCGPARACSLQGFDCQGRQVFHFQKPFRVDACCLGCCLMEMRAYSPQNHLIGTVHQSLGRSLNLNEFMDKTAVCLETHRLRCFGHLKEGMWNPYWWSMFTPLLEVCDSEGASKVRIQGSCCPCRCSSNQHFQVVSNVGEQLGTIWKKWPGFNVEQNMDHEYFGLDVPPSLESQTKLLLLAATFLLNHMFFEMS